MEMTLSQAKGNLKFARRMYQLYKQTKQPANAQSARRHMIQLYLIIRKLR